MYSMNEERGKVHLFGVFVLLVQCIYSTVFHCFSHGTIVLPVAVNDGGYIRQNSYNTEGSHISNNMCTIMPNMEEEY